MFEPLWKAKLQSLTVAGHGLMSREVSGQLDLVDEFEVFPGRFTLTAQPKTGRVLADGIVLVQADPGTLVWFRRMGIQMGTHDPNSSQPDCLFYGLGIESGGARKGCRLYHDGRVEIGL